MNLHNNKCRACGNTLEYTFANLGLSPISNAFVKAEDDKKKEILYPLHVFVCHRCWLVQLADVTRADSHFHDNYAYFSSFSTTWLEHARKYVNDMIDRFNLDKDSRVMEIASNDGYLLQYFVQADIPCLGIEPTANTAAAARLKGVESREIFFGCNSAEELVIDGWKADLLLGNNVLAHVPDINDFVNAMAKVLKQDGVITLEFPHILKLIEGNQFDTIYHEHYFYLSLTTLMPIFEKAGLRVFDVQHLCTHGGSLRIYICHMDSIHSNSNNVSECMMLEEKSGIHDINMYSAFDENIRETRQALLAFFASVKRENKKIVAYGAAAKGNTLLNYCGVKKDFIDYVVDKNPAKQGCLLPGSQIPVLPPDIIYEDKPDYLLILPWNIKDEVIGQMSGIREWGGKFVLPIPTLEIIH